MKHFILLTVFLTEAIFLLGQGGPIGTTKPAVDTPAFFNWPALLDWPTPAISNDGQFALYATKNVPSGVSTLTVQALNSKKEIVLPQAYEATFTDNSKYTISLHSGDSLCLLRLADNNQTYINRVSGFKLFMRNNVEWLAYTVKEPKKKLVLQNISTGTQTVYNDVSNYLLCENGSSLILQVISGIDSSHSIRWVNLLTNSDQEIWKGKQESNLVLNKDGTQLAFLVLDSNTNTQALWLYCKGEEKARNNLTNKQITVPKNMALDAIECFSGDGSQLFAKLRPSQQLKKVLPITPVNVWSYTDALLQCQQLHELKLGSPSYLAVLNIATSSSFRRLLFEDETITALTDSLLLLTGRRGEEAERYWNMKACGSNFLANVNTGNRTKIPISWPKFSPRGKYLIGYGPDETWAGDMYVFETATGITRNITSNIPIPQMNDEFQLLLTQKSRGLILAGWLADETSVFIYDTYDIWQIDPSGARPPLNLTNGRKDQWVYRLGEKHIPGDIIATPSSSLILIGFNKATKQNGFYKLSLGRTKGPELLFAGDYRFHRYIYDRGSHLLKARDADLYLMNRESARESRNIFATTDFKSFTRLSKIEPEKTVNWLTTELINFNTLDGTPSQAILYKPENFDSSRKYPMIIQYYEKKSDELNWYRQPVVDNGGELDIPWFVSHGYLVLLPDIQYKIGEPGPSSLKAVEGAALFIMQRSYVDKSHIGIQGHSFGGYETNYIVTHSNMFAAAVSSSGISNLISDFGNVWPGDMSRQEYWEMRNGRIGTTPWQNTELYVKNSPIFYINNVTTPLLMLQNRNDKNVHFEEGLQFFTGLRRAGKRCWMLEYDNGGHGVWGDEYKDYLIRMTQFFDHYLKRLPAPKWMTRGIPATMKGIDNGLELDTEIPTPWPGLLMDQQEPAINNLLSGKDIYKTNK